MLVSECACQTPFVRLAAWIITFAPHRCAFRKRPAQPRGLWMFRKRRVGYPTSAAQHQRACRCQRPPPAFGRSIEIRRDHRHRPPARTGRPEALLAVNENDDGNALQRPRRSRIVRQRHSALPISVLVAIERTKRVFRNVSAHRSSLRNTHARRFPEVIPNVDAREGIFISGGSNA
jgi:hypothetical protein